MNVEKISFGAKVPITTTLVSRRSQNFRLPRLLLGFIGPNAGDFCYHTYYNPATKEFDFVRILKHDGSADCTALLHIVNTLIREKGIRSTESEREILMSLYLKMKKGVSLSLKEEQQFNSIVWDTVSSLNIMG